MYFFYFSMKLYAKTKKDHRENWYGKHQLLNIRRV